jgi:hypothetical protein
VAAEPIERPELGQHRLRPGLPPPQEALLEPAAKTRREAMRFFVTAALDLRQGRQERHPLEQPLEQLAREPSGALLEHQPQRARVLVHLGLQLELEQ